MKANEYSGLHPHVAKTRIRWGWTIFVDKVTL
jgi:hypothetical protein